MGGQEDSHDFHFRSRQEFRPLLQAKRKTLRKVWNGLYYHARQAIFLPAVLAEKQGKAFRQDTGKSVVARPNQGAAAS